MTEVGHTPRAMVDEKADTVPQESCAICIQPILAPASRFPQIRCSHPFHLKCLSRWLDEKYQEWFVTHGVLGHQTECEIPCPLCRVDITGSLSDVPKEFFLTKITRKKPQPPSNNPLEVGLHMASEFFLEMSESKEIIDNCPNFVGRVGKGAGYEDAVANSPVSEQVILERQLSVFYAVLKKQQEATMTEVSQPWGSVVVMTPLTLMLSAAISRVAESLSVIAQARLARVQAVRDALPATAESTPLSIVLDKILDRP
jgi:hypothetical protein